LTLRYSNIQVEFRELFRSLDVKLSLTKTEWPDPAHPTMPILNFFGEMQAPETSVTMMGRVEMMVDNQVHWLDLGTFIYLLQISGDQLEGNDLWRCPYLIL
jgi:hypothetical protein